MFHTILRTQMFFHPVNNRLVHLPTGSIPSCGWSKAPHNATKHSSLQKVLFSLTPLTDLGSPAWIQLVDWMWRDGAACKAKLSRQSRSDAQEINVTNVMSQTRNFRHFCKRAKLPTVQLGHIFNDFSSGPGNLSRSYFQKKYCRQRFTL